MPSHIVHRDISEAPPATIRVAILASEGTEGRGGIGRITAYLVRRLAEHHPEIEVSVHRSRFSEAAIAKHLSVPFALAAFAASACKADVVHINIAPRGSTWRKMLFARVAHVMGKRVVLHLHGSGYDEYYAQLSPSRQAQVRAFFGRAGAVVALSEYWRRFMLSALELDADKVHVIPNGVPAPEAAIEKDRSGAPLIAFVGVIGPRKGADVLLASLAELKALGLPYRAIVGGNGEVEEAVALARTLGLGVAVEFPGWMDEATVDTLLRRAEIFVLPSRAENQPVAILEAMAREAAVVASNVGAIPEQVSEGETGLLVAPGDGAALTAALAALIRSPELRERFGKAGRVRFDAYFSVDSFAQRFAALYQAVACEGISR